MRALIFTVAIGSSWYGMQAVHELGHVLAAWLTGGTVQRVVLTPLDISRTDVSPNPQPLIVAWGGPLIGSIVPLLGAVVLGTTKPAIQRWANFFAGFCLIANGAYIGAGSFIGVGDAGDLLRHGAPQGSLVAFGLAAFSAGLWMWHRLTQRTAAT